MKGRRQARTPALPLDGGRQITDRKLEHVTAALHEDVAGRPAGSWNDVHLVHQALPEVDLEDIDLSATFLGARLAAPVAISSMTGGHPAVKEINAVLARLAQDFGLAMGVGSQRAALIDPRVAHTYAVVREQAPDAFVIANVGAPQLIAQAGHPAFVTGQVEEMVALVGADALAVHLNALQEATQSEGDRRAAGCARALGRLAGELSVPVIAKETGAGFCREQALLVARCGVAAIDVGGAGGSSMAAIEMHRSLWHDDGRAARLGQLFKDWGIATPVSVVESAVAGLPLVASGGILTGLDAAKALALGADLVGVGRPFLQAATEGYGAAVEFLEGFLAELRVAMFLSGAGSVAGLHCCDVVVGGETGRWLELRGIDVAALARRRCPLASGGEPAH
jgi:isopentenyl-diphosphate delta-isomerase